MGVRLFFFLFSYFDYTYRVLFIVFVSMSEIIKELHNVVDDAGENIAKQEYQWLMKKVDLLKEEQWLSDLCWALKSSLLSSDFVLDKNSSLSFSLWWFRQECQDYLSSFSSVELHNQMKLLKSQKWSSPLFLKFADLLWWREWIKKTEKSFLLQFFLGVCGKSFWSIDSYAGPQTAYAWFDSIMNEFNLWEIIFSWKEDKVEWQRDWNDFFEEQGEDLHDFMSRISQMDIVQHFFPSCETINALCFSQKFIHQDLPDRLKNAPDDPYHQAYRDIYETSLMEKKKQRLFDHMFTCYCDQFGEWIDFNSDSYVFAGNRWAGLPSYKRLAENHQDAIDIFYDTEKVEWNVEYGPDILAYQWWVVVAAKDDWIWWSIKSSFEGGWITPKWWNGLIIFNPVTQEYQQYRHLSSVDVSVWDLVPAGAVLWKWWNTWLNARKKWHGHHLDFSISHFVDGKGSVYKDCYELHRRLR